MCGRYASAARSDDLAEMTGARDLTGGLPASPNVAPTTEVAALVDEPAAVGRTRVLRAMRWGLVPSWATAVGAGALMINARVESAAGKPAFREPLKRRRCLVPAAGWYEWAGGLPTAGEGGRARRQPFLTGPASGGPLLLAGIWTTWRPAGGGDRVHSVAIITRPAPPDLAWLHDRAPLLVTGTNVDAWLDPAGIDPAPLLRQLLAAGDPPLATHPVDPAVGDVRRQEPELVRPVRLAAPVSRPASVARVDEALQAPLF